MAEAERIIADPRLYSSTKSFDIIAQQVIAPNIEPLYRIIESNRNQRTVIVASGICLGARMAQEKLSIPLATIHLQPALIRSRVDGGLQGRIPMGRNLPRWWKNSVYRLVDRFYVDRQLGGPVNRFRASLGLPPVQRVFERWIYSPQLVIGLFPSWFAPVQPDWPPDTHLTGIVLHDAGSHYGLPPEVEQFLSSGDPPVLFTPGCAGANLQTFFSESVEACRRTGLRAMLVASFPQQLPPNLPSGVRAFSYLPFSRVLSLCAALVHPGGELEPSPSPSLPVFRNSSCPTATTKPDNALRIRRLGLGLSIDPSRYTAQRVASLLRRLMNDGQIRARCRQYSAQIDSVTSVARAVQWIESLASALR